MKPPHNRFIYSFTRDISPVPTSHHSGEKKVVCNGFEPRMNVKQVAVGSLNPGECIAAHVHPDMDESYYILEGKGIMYIDGRPYDLRPDIFIHVPAETSHRIECSYEKLRFVYSCLEIAADPI